MPSGAASLISGVLSPEPQVHMPKYRQKVSERFWLCALIPDSFNLELTGKIGSLKGFVNFVFVCV